MLFKILQQKLPYRLLIAFAGGLLLPLALAPYHYTIIAWCVPSLLFLLSIGLTKKQSFLFGWLVGIGLWLVGGAWLYQSIHYYGDTPAYLAAAMIALVAVLMGLFNAVQWWVYRLVFAGHSVLAFASLWVLFEWIKSWFLTGFPWLYIGYAFTDHPLHVLAPVGGVYLVGLVALLISATVAQLAYMAWQTYQARRTQTTPPSAITAPSSDATRGAVYPLRHWVGYALCLVLWVGSVVYFSQVTWVKSQYDGAGNPVKLKVSLLQGNIPQDLKWLIEYRDATLEIYKKMSIPEWGQDVIVWPESSIPLFQIEVPELFEYMRQQTKKTGSVWVTGVPYLDVPNGVSLGQLSETDFPPFYNSIMAMGDHSGGVYKKQRLVPYGEYIPFSGALSWVLPNLKRSLTMTNFSAGTAHQQPLRVKGKALGASICYEIAYPDITRKNAQHADFLVTLSNDAWFNRSAGPWQHLQMAQMRAQENQRYIMRATNTGVTAIINPQGHIVAQLPQFKRAVLRGEMYALTGTTWYTRWGDTVFLILAGVFMAAALLLRKLTLNNV